MKIFIFILAASVVSSSQPEKSADPAARPPRGFYYYHQHVIPSSPRYYNQAPLLIYQEPFDLIEPSQSGNPFEIQRSQTIQGFKSDNLPTPALDQILSDEDDEAEKQMEILKNLYAETESNGVVLPSIIPMPRGFLLLKASAFASLVSAFSIRSASIIKTLYYPAFG